MVGRLPIHVPRPHSCFALVAAVHSVSLLFPSTIPPPFPLQAPANVFSYEAVLHALKTSAIPMAHLLVPGTSQPLAAAAGAAPGRASLQPTAATAARRIRVPAYLLGSELAGGSDGVAKYDLTCILDEAKLAKLPQQARTRWGATGQTCSS